MRSEFILQFHTMGRVGESSSLKSSCIKYLDEEDDENQARTIAVRTFHYTSIVAFCYSNLFVFIY